MKLVKSLLLGSAAGFAAITGAQAADLPSKKAAPVEYVRVCSVHGAGFFYIPGSDTCIKFGGRVRAEFGYRTPQNSWSGSTKFAAGVGTYSSSFVYGRDRDATGFSANGRLNVDVRTSTEWGLLRAFFRYDFYRNTGVFIGARTGGQLQESSNLDKAFIQWAGLTAGRATSFFDFYANGLNFTSIAGSDQTVNLFAYTATFGSGFSATLSIEDRVDRQRTNYWALPLTVDNKIDGTTFYNPWFGTSDVGLGGTRMPDIVANLRVDQGWGSAQLSGALHQIRYAALVGSNAPSGFFTAANSVPCVSGGPVGLCDPILDTDYGYAIQAGVKINLPMLAAGDQLWLQAAYAKGAVGYLGPVGISLYNAAGLAPDAWVFPTYNADGKLDGGVTSELTSGWNFTAAVLHYWTPTVRQALFGSYLNISNESGQAYFPALGTNSAFNGFSNYGAPDVTVWQVGSNVIWSPVSGFDIGLEIGYINTDAGNVPTNLVTSGNNTYWNTSGSEDQWYTRLRVVREF
jgi:hypothetical protein